MWLECGRQGERGWGLGAEQSGQGCPPPSTGVGQLPATGLAKNGGAYCKPDTPASVSRLPLCPRVSGIAVLKPGEKEREGPHHTDSIHRISLKKWTR